MLLNFEKASAASILAFSRHFQLCANFIPANEQQAILDECRRALVKATWSLNHFDTVIQNYREISVSKCKSRYPAIHQWCSLVGKVSPRLVEPMDPHILELSRDGHIDYHIDSVSCGD